MTEYIISNKDNTKHFVIKTFNGCVHITRVSNNFSIDIVADLQTCFNELEEFFHKYTEQNENANNDRRNA